MSFDACLPKQGLQDPQYSVIPTADPLLLGSIKLSGPNATKKTITLPPKDQKGPGIAGRNPCTTPSWLPCHIRSTAPISPYRITIKEQ